MPTLRNEEKTCPICLNNFKKTNMTKCTMCAQYFCANNYFVGGTRPTGTCAICNQERHAHIQQRAVFKKGQKYYKVTARNNRNRMFRARQINSSGDVIGPVQEFTKNDKNIKWKLSYFNGNRWSAANYVVLQH